MSIIGGCFHTDIQIGIIWEQACLASMPLKLNQTKLTMLKLTADISFLPASVGTTLTYLRVLFRTLHVC